MIKELEHSLVKKQFSKLAQVGLRESLVYAQNLGRGKWLMNYWALLYWEQWNRGDRFVSTND